MIEETPQLCTAIVVEDSQGRVLLLRRAPRMGRLGGLWHLPGDRHFCGETHVQCAHRALREDTGLQAYQFTYLGTTFHDHREGIVYRADFASGVACITQPVIEDQLGWFDPSDPPSPLFSGTAEVLDWLRPVGVAVR
jgi:ADP-ribose pyrophosphatase YjhB (NUDIX family)